MIALWVFGKALYSERLEKIKDLWGTAAQPLHLLLQHPKKRGKKLFFTTIQLYKCQRKPYQQPVYKCFGRPMSLQWGNVGD